MDINDINSAIIAGKWTNDEIDSILQAVKYARSRLATQIKYTLKPGSAVKFFSSKRGINVTGTITKVAQKYATVSTNTGLWKVPMNMLESA